MSDKKFLQAGPIYTLYIPLLESLKGLGGSGRRDEIEAYIRSMYDIDNQLEEQVSTGQTRLTNRLAWAKVELAKAGFLDTTQRGVIRLTEKALSTSLTPEQAKTISKQVNKEFAAARANKSKSSTEAEPLDEQLTDNAQIADYAQTDHRSQLLEILRNLPPSGFERLCQTLLREAGFEKVEVTGRSGDGGIDGKGILRVNPLVSFQVYFQCKRYSGSVGSGVIRDFRGSIMGRADKGIILTTGTFTSEATKEAIRDGAIPLELVDGQKLLDMLEQLELGVTARQITVYEINPNFFEEFKIS